MSKRVFVIIDFLLFTIVLILHFGCDKPSTPSDPFLTMPQQVKDYIAFKPGSYWVYRDSSTGIIDSQYVVRYSSQTNGGSAEASTIFLKTNLDTGTVCIDAERYKYRDFCQYCTITVNVVKNYYSSNWTIATLLIYPFKKDTFNGDTFTCFVLSRNYNVSGMTFSNVIKTTTTMDGIENGQPVITYLASHIGLIRKELLGTHHVWNLIRYHVVQ